jgi:sigma-B regulation protein RsbU (phosphoserine phosphatase)
MPATPVAQPVVTPPPATPVQNDSLFGTLKQDFLSETPLGSLDENEPASQAAATSKEPSDLGWMDEMEAVGGNGKELPPSERTDMIKARAVQQGLMQKVPEIPGYHFAVSFEACSDISGDFYQFVRLPDGRHGFALGDVSGHGVHAGLIMSMAKKTFEIYASTGLSPAETLSKVNDALARDLGGKFFISMVYALLDPTERTLTWARAGHNPSLRYNPAEHEVEEIKPPGMVVGMKSGPIFRQSIQEQVTHLKSGDLILLYTDGVTETMNLQQEEFDNERLYDVMRKFAGDGPEKLIDRLMEILRHFRGPQPPADDSTLLALTVD